MASTIKFSTLARGFTRCARGAGYHAMLECYFDDSSDDRREKFLVSGGLIGSPEQWDAFIIHWSPIARQLNKPFRSAECECGFGQFRGWPKSERDELMARLVSAVRVCRLSGFASIVPVEAYRDAFPDCRDDDPYLLTLPHTIMNMAVIGHRANQDVNIWFECGKWDAAISRAFQSVKGMAWKPAQRLRAISLGSKDEYPLQSADLIAREAYKYLNNRGIRPTRKPLLILQGMICLVVWTEDALRHLAEHGGPQNLEFLSSWDESTSPKLAHYWRKL